jgi:hypothetical protein
MATSNITVGGSYWSAQLDTFDALESGDYDLVVFRAGYAGGKTLLASDWIHQTSVEVPRSDNLLMAPDYQKGGPATYKTFFERLPGDETIPAEGGDPENSPIVAEYNRNEKRLTYKNGSVARLGSADRWNRYAGSEFNAIACDEPAHYDTTNLYDLVEMLTSRQRTPQGPNVMLWTSTGAGFDQYYDITERQVDADENPLPWADRMKVIVGSSLDNPFLPEDAREKLERQFSDTERAAQALHGGFAAPTGLVYGDFSRDRHVRPDAELRDRLVEDWRVYGYDHGWDDPRVVLEIGKTDYDQLAVVDEFYRSGVEYHKAVAWLTDNDKPTGTVHAEHEPEHQEAFRSAGYPVEPAVKDLDEGIPAVRNRLDWRDDPQGRPGLLVSDACSETIRELMDYQEDEVGTADAVDHAADSLRYAIMGVDYTEPTPDPSDVFGGI